MTMVVSAERVEQEFGADIPPRCEVPEHERFVLGTRSLHTGGGFDRSRDYTDLSIPLTGPVRLPGVRAGDRIRVDLHGIDIADRGALVTLPGRGAVSGLGTSGHSVPIKDGYVEFGDGVRIPVRPMVGKIGVGVPGEAPGSSTVGVHGGNLDCKELTAGASIFLTAQTDGAALYAGDLHACQGDGESSLTGVEVEGAITLSWHHARPTGSDRPLVLSADDRLLTIGDGDSLAEAVQAALDDLLALTVDAFGWTRERAAMFLSIAADVGICQLVNARLSAKAAVDVAHFAGTPHASWLTRAQP